MTVGLLDSRLEGGPFDGKVGTVDDPPPSRIWMARCGPCVCSCPVSHEDDLHYWLHDQRGGERYQLVGVNEADWAVYWHHSMGGLPLGARARELIMQPLNPEPAK